MDHMFRTELYTCLYFVNDYTVLLSESVSARKSFWSDQMQVTLYTTTYQIISVTQLSLTVSVAGVRT